MRFNHTILIATLAVVTGAAFTGPAFGQENAPEPVTFQVTGTDEAGEYWFEFEGISGRNPTVPVEPGQEVTIEFTSAGSGNHNFHVMAPVDAKTEVLPAGENETLTFTVPADATTLEYQCDPHAILDMKGTFTTQTAGNGGDNGNGGDGNESPGFGFAAIVAGLAVALFLVRRK